MNNAPDYTLRHARLYWFSRAAKIIKQTKKERRARRFIAFCGGIVEKYEH